MGGNSSKKKVDLDTSPLKEFPLNGLKIGDTVIIRGECYAGSRKFFRINFYSEKDTAFHFKVITLTADGLTNKVKMNAHIGGKWGTEEKLENMIYLNHHFELKFTCFEHYFSVQVNGTEIHKYKHRVPAEKLTMICLDGDANYYYAEMPNQVRQLETTTTDFQLPTRDQVKLFVQNLTPNFNVHPLSAESNEEEIERLSELMTEGLDITKTLLGENKNNFLKNIEKYAGYLEKAFAAGNAVYGFIKFVAKFGEPSEMSQVIKKLDEIKAAITKLEESIQKGFADVIEHMDLVQFREDVKIPVRTLFDLFIRCYTVRGKQPVEDFKRHCREKQSPRDIFSAMYEFLDSKRNIFETHLKTKKYVYSVYDEWADALFNYATKLIVMNMFYYGILCEEHASSGNKDPLINEQDEIADLIDQLLRMNTRLKEIEVDRMATFHTEGHAAEFLRERFKNIKYDFAAGYFESLPQESLSKIAYEMKNSWKDFNGPEDYYIMAIRGTYGIDVLAQKRYAGWDIGDRGRVTVVQNIGKAREAKTPDSLCLVLIQPITKETREANEKAYTDYREKLKEMVESVHDSGFHDYMPKYTIPKLKEKLGSSFPLKPLLIMYNTGLTQMWKQGDSISTWPYNYSTVSEAWSSPGGPHCWKYHWRHFIQLTDFTRQVQVIFQ